MAERVRICDIAEELGLSTATVSNVIHGKTGQGLGRNGGARDGASRGAGVYPQHGGHPRAGGYFRRGI